MKKTLRTRASDEGDGPMKNARVVIGIILGAIFWSKTLILDVLYMF